MTSEVKSVALQRIAGRGGMARAIGIAKYGI
jgi:hypothetical protein